jgi:glutamine synthetase
MARARSGAAAARRTTATRRASQRTTQVKSRDRATSSVAQRRAVVKRIKDEGITSVLFWFTDIEGHLKSFAITPDEVAEALNDGMGFDGSSITGFNAIEESDMVAIPDPATFQVLPSREGETKVGRMICDVVTPSGEPYDGDPRYVLRRALERMNSLGFDTFNVGPELEYFLFRDSSSTETLDEGGYFAMTTQDAATELRNDTIKALESVGIPIEYHHHEVGPSQHEIDMRYAPALDMADHTMTYRLIVKEIAAKNGVYATFMPKPLFGENGSGMHTHMSLFKGGRNAFFDAKDPYHLSPTGKAFIAGLLRHAREMAAIFAQWVNSYKRLVPGYEAPVYVAWSQRNRSALVRIPLYKPGSEQATRAEIRCPDPACNPYLTFAALLHSGLEGIERGYELAEPMETNLYHLSAGERKDRGIESLPQTLGEAIEELASSPLMRQALGEHIFEKYVELKRSEWDEYRVQLSQWELEKYLPAL